MISKEENKHKEDVQDTASSGTSTYSQIFIVLVNLYTSGNSIRSSRWVPSSNLKTISPR